MWRGKAGQRRPRGAEEASPPPALEFPDDQAAGPQFDDSDWPTELRGLNGSQKIMNITSSFANQLLLVSLLEHLCHIYAQDPTRSRRLFQLLCKTFTQMRLLSDFAVCEEFSSLRLQHNRAIAALMKAANKQILNEEFGNGNPCTNSREGILFEAQTSRYINEFDEISRLGKGAYGTVYKVRNKLDGQFYAIKKILIKKATKRDCMKVLREVKVLAGLQHPNIVGYHTAWMEHVQPTCLKGESNLNLPSLKVCSEQGSSVDPCCDQDMEDGSSIIFADLNPEDSVDGNSERNAVHKSHKNSYSSDSSGISKYNENPASVVPHGDQDRHNMSTNDSYSDEQSSQKGVSLQQQCEEDESNEGVFESMSSITAAIVEPFLQMRNGDKNDEMNKMMEYHLMLHIQMQLCEISLWDWIADRNKSCFKAEDASSPYHHIDNQGTLKIFQELLEGVYYIHSMGVMHRDIKPRNIFLQGPDYHVKIGDFGLACRDIIQEDPIHLLSAKKRTELMHTSGVGTCLYASPEQLEGSHYDVKSDMYSLGVILFELFQPFGTEMERTKVLMDLRNSNIPLSFSRKCPVQTKYIKLLTSLKSSNRPTAAQLLESELFHNTANVICSLQQKVIQQEEEIRLLKERVQLLLQEKEERQRIQELGSPV